MALQSVWIRTLSDGLVRADQVIGISAHRTPSLSGKPGRWLLTAALNAPAGSGDANGWDMANLHRTLLQSDLEPQRAPEALARLLAQLSASGVAGIVTPRVLTAGDVRFDFEPFDGGNGHAGEVPFPDMAPRETVGVG